MASVEDFESKDVCFFHFRKQNRRWICLPAYDEDFSTFLMPAAQCPYILNHNFNPTSPAWSDFWSKFLLNRYCAILFLNKRMKNSHISICIYWFQHCAHSILDCSDLLGYSSAVFFAFLMRLWKATLILSGFKIGFDTWISSIFEQG